MDDDTGPIREALLAALKDTPMGVWLSGNPTDDELRNRLLNRVRWEMNAAPSEALSEQVRDEIGSLLLAQGFPIVADKTAVRSLLGLVLERASESELENRRLKSQDLIRAIEEIATPGALARLKTHSMPAEAPTTEAHSVLISEVEQPFGPFAGRSDTVNRVLVAARGEPVIWLHGSHGVGKSTLAKLLALHVGGRWINLDLRPVQQDVGGCLAAWRELTRVALSEPSISGIIVDDLNDQAQATLSPRLAALARVLASRGARILVTSSQAPSLASLPEVGATARAVVQAPYFSETEVRELVSASPSPSPETIEAWTKFIHLGGGGGHPLLVAARVVSLRARNWPIEAFAETLGMSGDDAARATRDKARRQLLDDLSRVDQARSIDAGNVLRRIACVFDRVDDGLARRLASTTPAIANPGDALALMRGTWLEPLPRNDFRVTPVINDIVADVAPAEAERWRRVAAEYWLESRVLNERTLPLCFWNAYLGKHVWALMMLCQIVNTLPREKLVGAAALLSPLTLLASDQSLFPDEPFVAAHLRLLQFDVADAMEDGERAANVATRLLAEIDAVSNDDVKTLITSISAQKVLTAQSALTASSVVLEFALRLRRQMAKIQLLMGSSFIDIAEGARKEFGHDFDAAALLFAGTIHRVRSSAQFLEMVRALDAIPPADRNSFIAATAAVFDGLSVFVSSGWAQDQLLDSSMADALLVYEQAEVVISKWQRDDLLVELAIARSVILDEGLNEYARAIDVVVEAEEKFGKLPPFIRQKAKVLSHMGNDEAAVSLISSIEGALHSLPSFDKSLALRDAGVWAGRAGKYREASNFFDKALVALDEKQGFAEFKTGLVVERALALWHASEPTTALAALSDAFNRLEQIDPAKTRQSERVHQVARAAAGLFLHDVLQIAEPRPVIAFGHAAALAAAKERLMNLDLKPLADNWRILALVEVLSGVSAGVLKQSETKQGGLRVSSTEGHILRAQYEQHLIRGDLDEAFKIGITATSAMKLLHEQRTQGLDLPKATVQQLASFRVEELLADPTWREVLLHMPTDVILLGHAGVLDAAVVSRLAMVCKRHLGSSDGTENLLRAATGRYPVGNSAPLSYQTVAAVTRFREDGVPIDRLRRDILVVYQTAQSYARRTLETTLIPKLAKGWEHAVQQQAAQFQDLEPYRSVLDKAIASATGLKGVAKLISEIAPAVGQPLDESWRAVLAKISE